MTDTHTPLRHTRRGRRQGKPLRPRQKALMEQVLPSIQITLTDGDKDRDPLHWFENITDIWLEIGFGKGEHLAWQAAHNPDVGIIGCEPFATGVAGLLGEIEKHGLSNVRIFTEDAAWLLESLKPACLSRVFLLFPDPWPKARHHKRRFISPERLDLLAHALKPGSEFRMATDHEDYATWMVRHMANRSDFEWLADAPADWRRRPAPPDGDWPGTRYEAKAIERGDMPVYLRYRRL